MGWAVVPGCNQGVAGRRCGRSDCLSAGPHPASEHGELIPTRDEMTICRWWRRGPAAPILLATGRFFDVLDVPGYAVAEALRRLELTGHRLGPLAQSGDGRLLIWMAPGSRLLAELVDREPWAYDDLDLHVRGAGEYVMAPPSGDACWLDAPVPYAHSVLPRYADIVGAVADACRRSDPRPLELEAWRRPVARAPRS